jgi:hypothetical protein
LTVKRLRQKRLEDVLRVSIAAQRSNSFGRSLSGVRAVAVRGERPLRIASASSDRSTGFSPGFGFVMFVEDKLTLNWEA